MHFPNKSNRAVILPALAILFCTVVSSPADTKTKADNATNLRTGTSWVGGSAPGTADIALWDSTVATTTAAALGGSVTWGEIQVTNPGVDFTITNGNTLTLNGVNGVGIDMSASTRNFTINSGVALGGAQSWTVNAGKTLTIGGIVNLNAYLLTTSGAGSTNISGDVSGTGGITINNGAAVTLSGSNLFTGTLTVAAGSLSVGTINNSNGSTGSIGKSLNSVVLGSSGATGTLVYTGATASTTKTFTLASGGTGAFQIDNASTSLTLSGVIDGGGTLNKTGAGTLVLSNANNTYSGGATITNGALTASANGALGTGVITFSGGALNLASNQTNNVTVSAATTSSLNVTGANRNFGNASSSFGGSGTLNVGLGGFTLVEASPLTSFSGTLDFSPSSSGAFTFSGTANTGSSTATFNLGTGAATVRASDFASTSKTVNLGALSGGANTFLEGSAVSGSATDTFAIGANGATTVFAGTIRDGQGTTAHTVAINKVGTGTLTLTGANTYTGTTTVGTAAAGAGNLSNRTANGGRLEAGGAAALGNTSAIVVNNGGTLAITNNASTDHVSNTAPISLGTLGGTGVGGTLAIVTGVNEGSAATRTGGAVPGTSVTGLGALTLTSNSTLDFDASGNSTLLVFSSFNPAGFKLSITGYTNSNFDGTANSGQAADDRLIFATDQTANLGNFDFGAGTTATQIQLDSGFYEIGIVAVPEPATVFSGLGMTGLLVFAGRRKVFRSSKLARCAGTQA